MMYKLYRFLVFVAYYLYISNILKTMSGYTSSYTKTQHITETSPFCILGVKHHFFDNITNIFIKLYGFVNN